jgi:hypothetical protein
MEHGEAEKHSKMSLDERGTFVHPRDIWGDETERVVMRRAEETARYREWVL